MPTADAASLPLPRYAVVACLLLTALILFFAYAIPRDYLRMSTGKLPFFHTFYFHRAPAVDWPLRLDPGWAGSEAAMRCAPLPAVPESARQYIEGAEGRAPALALRCETRVEALGAQLSPLQPESLFPPQAGWERAKSLIGISTGHLAFGETPLWVTLAVVLAPLAGMLLLLRGHDWRRDRARAWQGLRRRPWLPLLPFLLTMAAMALLLPQLTFKADAEAVLGYVLSGNFAVAALSAALWEETVMRGWLYRELRDRLALPWQALLNAGLFAGLHAFSYQSMLAEGWWFLLPLFVAGLTLFYIRHRHGSLLLCILAHTLQNAVVLLLTHYAAAQAG